jgi:hypothetical protein
MNKKEKIWTIVLILLIIAVLFILFSRPTIIPRGTGDMTLQERIDTCPKNYTEEGVTYPDPGCVTSLAVEYQNGSICNIFPSHGTAKNPSGKGYTCVVEVIIAKGEISECGRLYSSSHCRQEIAKKDLREGFSPEDLISIIQPEIEIHCEDVEVIFNEHIVQGGSALDCSVCSPQATGDYLFADCSEVELMGISYCILENGENYEVKVNIPLSVGGYNTHGQTEIATYIVAKNGEILSVEHGETCPPY